MNSNPSIVLVKPQLPENIGLVARAIDNCGLKNLILVNPREKWPNQKALDSSANSSKIIENISVFKNLNEALSKFHYVIATSSRKRFLQKKHYNKFSDLFSEISKNKKIAIVFGPENSGLSNDELMLCDSILNINLSKSNTSLNLSHAVLLFAYQWKEYFSKKNIQNNKINENIALKSDFDYFMNFLKCELEEVGFLRPSDKSKNMFNNIQTMFLRSALSKSEIKTLWGMIKKLRNSRK